jgi:ferredoxin-thioredoxin reductase catalytic subunit
MTAMTVDSRKKALHFFFEKIVYALGYKFTPDREMVDFSPGEEVNLERKHGIPFCPCQPIKHERSHDMAIGCPCIPFHRKHFDFMKRYWCGLFVHKHVTDPDTLPQIPFSEVPLE